MRPSTAAKASLKTGEETFRLEEEGAGSPVQIFPRSRTRSAPRGSVAASGARAPDGEREESSDRGVDLARPISRPMLDPTKTARPKARDRNVTSRTRIIQTRPGGGKQLMRGNGIRRSSAWRANHNAVMPPGTSRRGKDGREDQPPPGRTDSCRCYLETRNALDLRSFFVSWAIKSPTRVVETGRFRPGSSAVRTPRLRTFSIDVSTAWARCSCRQE